MFTPRAWLLLLVVFLMLAWAFFDHLFLPSRSASDAPNVSLLLFALGLALWFGWEWFHFLLGVRLAKRRIRLRRVLADERGPIDILWAHQPVNVQLEIVLDSVWPLPYVRLADRLPATAQFTEGQAVYEGRLDSASPVLLHYRLRSSGIGSIRFEGVHIKIADCQGLFYAATFVPDRTVYRVLPPLADIRGHAPSKKRHNLLPPPGVHRLLRPGSGSELLDLRDYLPGDPPKTIAWKASARRDRLMTKEFESEVPIRCTMFIDTSDSVRWGMPGRNLMTSLIEIAAGVSQAANGVRDLAGICLFDEESTTYLRPGRGPRHLSKIMNMLAEAADRQPLFPDASLVSVLIPSYQLACEVYPECLHPEVNDFPAWLAWLLPPSASTFRQPTQQDRLYQWMPVWLAIIGTTSVLLTAGLFAAILFVASHNTSDTMLFILFPLLFLTMLGVIKVPSLLFAEKRRHYRWRKKLSALLSALHHLGPGGLGLLLEDEQRFVLEAQKFLFRHRVPYTPSQLDDPPRLQISAGKKMEVLAKALLRAVRLGHDNELFVLLFDGAFADPGDLEKLERAVQVAVGKHHQVMVVCPLASTADGTPLESSHQRQTESEQALHRLKSRFARFHVPVVSARRDDSVRLILNRIDQLRMVTR